MNKQKVCPTCNDEDLEIITVSPNRAYTLCTKNEHSGRDYFNPQELGGNTNYTLQPILKNMFGRSVES
jgi:hypothetical protein